MSLLLHGALNSDLVHLAELDFHERSVVDLDQRRLFMTPLCAVV